MTTKLDPQAAATILKLRSDLMIRLSKLIDARGLTQAKAATLFEVAQPRISGLVRGKVDRFSIDTLIAMLRHLASAFRSSSGDPRPPDPEGDPR